MTTLRVATFNIRNGRAFDGLSSWPFRRRATAATVRELDADVVGLQEVFGFQRRYLARRLPGYEVVGEGRGGGRKGEACPVLVRRGRVRVEAPRTRWYGDDRPGARLPGASFPRIATTCLLAVDGWAQPVSFTCTHLDERKGENRKRSIEQLLTWLDPATPRIVVGDLNTGPDDALFERFAEAGLRQALPPDAGGTNHDFTGRRDGRRIDHVLVSDELEVVDASVAYLTPGGRLPSDHWPVVATLRLRSGPSR